MHDKSPELVHRGEHRQSSTLIFPYLIRGGKPTLLYSWAMAFVFCTYNGYLQSRYLSQYAVYADDWVTQPRFLTGFALWLLGMLINIHSDHILRNLRKPGETGYRIPRGGLFEYVSGANYFGETVEWCGFALASWSLQGGAFALFTFCILLARANNHHHELRRHGYRWQCPEMERPGPLNQHVEESFPGVPPNHGIQGDCSSCPAQVLRCPERRARTNRCSCQQMAGFLQGVLPPWTAPLGLPPGPAPGPVKQHYTRQLPKSSSSLYVTRFKSRPLSRA
ncbi:3-oxo-5-alpha-steroid 4-dehydrogenase 1 isoform X5 [Ictidomys tridecemlineatus]